MDISIEQILSKSEYRKWVICKELYFKKKINNKILVDLCKCTLKTIRRDIEEINNDFFKEIEMPKINVKKGVVYLESDQEIPINTIYRIIFLDSDQIHLLNEIISNDKINIVSLSKKYYRTMNYIYKLIKILNNYLKLFELEIVKYKLVGEEYKICIFLFDFYWITFGGRDWPFKSISKNLCNEEVNELESSFFNKFSWIEREKLCFLIAIMIIRDKSAKNNIEIENLIYWKCLDKEGRNIIERSVEKLKFKKVQNKNLLMLITLAIICDKAKLRGIQLAITNFYDPLSKAGQRLILRLIEDGNKVITNGSINSQIGIIKSIHYFYLGEAYTLLAITPIQKNNNIVDLKIYPELVPFTNKQALLIIEILTFQNLISDTEYVISISSKYGEMEVENIIDKLKANSPKNFVYKSMWNSNENADLILTDLEVIPKKKKAIQIQFVQPFNKKRALEIIEKIKFELTY